VSDLCWCADFEPDQEREAVVCPICRALLLSGRGESHGRFQRRIRRHRMAHGARRVLAPLALLLALLAGGDRARAQTPFTLAHYTVPRFESAADTLCGQLGTTLERMGQIEIWWWPRGGMPYVLRAKNVAGMEGMRDSLHLPASPMGLARVSAIDAAGNRSCDDESRWVPFNESGAVGVGPPPVWRRRMGRRFDLQGRRMDPGPSGWYFGGAGDTLVAR
jgi:hypothetical protein